MGSLLGFFAAGPARIQALLLCALAMVAACLGLLVYGLWWRGEAYSARAERDVAVAQAEVLAGGLKACNAGVDEAKRVGAAAVAAAGELVAAARRLKQPARETVQRIETIIEKGTPAGAGCEDAWRVIEADRQKARGP